MPKKKEIPYFKARKTKRINNLSRAINKIDPAFKDKVSATEFSIGQIKAGVNDVTYLKDGIPTRIRYDKITTLGIKEQSSLLNKLNADRYELRQERALEQLKDKGKISWQFKKSIKEQNSVLFENIEEIETMIGDNKKDAIKKLFADLDVDEVEDIGEVADSFFQDGPDGIVETPDLFDFYRPGESGGFSELNTFTYNSYLAIRGV